MDAFVRQMALFDAITTMEVLDNSVITTRFSLTIWSLGVENIDGARERFCTAYVNNKKIIRGAENYRSFQRV